jgi:ABC-type amino acid transport substrate-binding protein
MSRRGRPAASIFTKETAVHRRQILRALAALSLTPALGRAADRPQNVGRDVKGQSLDDIIDRGFIQIGIYEDFPPYSWRNGDELKGVDVEIGKLIAEFIGVEPRFTLVSADENVDADMRNHVWRGHVISGDVVNVLLRVPYNRELALRNELVTLTGQYQNEQVAIAYDSGFYKDEKPVPAYFRFDKVGVENDSIADFYLSGIGNGSMLTNITRFRTPALAMAALRTGEVRAVMGARGQLEWGARDGIAVHAPPLPGLSVGTWTIGMAVRMNWRALSYSCDDAVRAAVADGRMARIYADHRLSWLPPVW